jgi:hypothetical protein
MLIGFKQNSKKLKCLTIYQSEAFLQNGDRARERRPILNAIAYTCFIIILLVLFNYDDNHTKSRCNLCFPSYYDETVKGIGLDHLSGQAWRDLIKFLHSL